MTDDRLLLELLEKPVGKAIKPPTMSPDDFTRQIEQRDGMVVATIRGEKDTINEGTARKYLIEEGLEPDEWVSTGFRKVKYGDTAAPFESVTFTFKRVSNKGELEIPIDELVESIRDYEPAVTRPTGSHGFLVLLGDMQFGKIDGDGPAGTVNRVVQCLNEAADQLVAARKLFDIGHVHIAWLGDHVEGFVSQGGANSWRTQLTLSEQIRLTRRVMLHALKLFAPLGLKVSMAALPGNHGETIRFAGSGITRYDDSHDTESLIAVKDVADMMPEAFGHVEFYVPDTDELIVCVEVANTVIAHHHGHKWRNGKHWDWWSGQAFGAGAMHQADVLLAGHLHHEHFEVQGARTFWGQPALESESTWFRHSTGISGAPGISVGVVKDGRVLLRQTIFAKEGVTK